MVKHVWIFYTLRSYPETISYETVYWVRFLLQVVRTPLSWNLSQIFWVEEAIRTYRQLIVKKWKYSTDFDSRILHGHANRFCSKIKWAVLILSLSFPTSLFVLCVRQKNKTLHSTNPILLWSADSHVIEILSASIVEESWDGMKNEMSLHSGCRIWEGGGNYIWCLDGFWRVWSRPAEARRDHQSIFLHIYLKTWKGGDFYIFTSTSC